jgi:S-formylglutathione hydrolase FrmB
MLLRPLSRLLCTLLLGSGLVATAHATDVDAVNIADGNGLHVVSAQAVDNRTTDITFATANLPFTATVRVVVPDGYADSGQRYPVLYLLHGGGGTHVDWTNLGAEQVTANQPVILIQPDGGKGSWYADALVPGADGLPRWETYITTQLIPWVDAHLRTEAYRNGRAIAGLSMGGYGAMSYAARHPNLFVSASAFSGAVDTSDALVANWIGVSPIIDVRLPYSIFGPYPADTALRQAHNPTNLAANLRGIHLAFYYGNGNAGPLDNVPTNIPPVVANFMGWIQENQVYQMNVNMDNRLNALGIAHDEHYYGNGMHAGPYWARDFQQEFPVIMATFANPPAPGNAVVDGDFEAADMGPWVCVNSCGTDHGAGLSQSGQGNGWARNWTGWNDIHQTVQVAANTPYHLSGWVRTSGNHHDGFFGVRTTSGTVIGEAHFGNSLNGYTHLTVDINTGSNTQVDVYAGVWGAWSDTWMQVDNVSLTPN